MKRTVYAKITINFGKDEEDLKTMCDEDFIDYALDCEDVKIEPFYLDRIIKN